MRIDVCFDSNVLLYLVDDSVKADRADALLADGGVVTTLVLAECAHVLAKKWKWPWQDATDLLTIFRGSTLVLPFGEEAIVRGTRYAERYRLQPFDAMIVAAGVLANCTTLYSEDMHDGLVIDGLTVRNPFRA
jgi:predicted nucleic acid-binding protein